MCGIAGIAGFHDSNVAEIEIRQMTNQLRRRGPDDHGIESWASALLGHRRLSIFDVTEAGHQPMLSDDRKVGIVFNGAIYNFRSLRRELESAGCLFRSETDTEVLLHGYHEWGIDKLAEKIDGMFAFGIWDDRTRELFLVRDRLGVKPLAYCLTGGIFAFASTVRSLRAGGKGAGLSETGLLEFLEFGFLTDENAIYDGIEKVKPGQIITWSNGAIKKRTYWSFARISRDSRVSFQDAVDETERLLLLAVEKRLQADVPVAALLSGGIDSSLICWAISKLGANVKAFTVGTPDDSFDETNAAIATAKLIGIDLDVLPLSEHNTPEVTTLARAFAEPFACSSALGMITVAEAVANEAKVLLTGDGGDDLFLGYPEHRYFFLSSRLGRLFPMSILKAANHRRWHFPESSLVKRAGSFLSFMSGGLGAVADARDGLSFFLEKGLIGQRLYPLTFSRHRIAWDVDSGRELITEFLEYDIRTRFVGEYLPKVDGSTMYHGLEARSPFLDLDLWNFASSLTTGTRLHRLRLKAILREIVLRRIGTQVATRKKQGFMIPAQRWLTGKWRQSFEEVLADSYLRRERLINTDKTLDAFRRIAPGDIAPKQFWFIYVLELWLRFEQES